jgi:hypothetical protein
VGGGDVGELGVGGEVRHGVDPEAVGVDRDQAERGARRGEDLPGLRVAGLLDDGGVAGVEPEPGEQVERLLRAAGDDDPLQPTADAARAPEIGGDGGPERRVARGRAVGEGGRGRIAGGAGAQAAPDAEG